MISELQIMCIKWTSTDSSYFISSPNPMFDHLLESSRWDDSNKWSNIGFGEELGILEIKIRTLIGALYKSLNLAFEVGGYHTKDID